MTIGLIRYTISYANGGANNPIITAPMLIEEPTLAITWLRKKWTRCYVTLN